MSLHLCPKQPLTVRARFMALRDFNRRVNMRNRAKSGFLFREEAVWVVWHRLGARKWEEIFAPICRWWHSSQRMWRNNHCYSWLTGWLLVDCFGDGWLEVEKKAHLTDRRKVSRSVNEHHFGACFFLHLHWCSKINGSVDALTRSWKVGWEQMMHVERGWHPFVATGKQRNERVGILGRRLS